MRDFYRRVGKRESVRNKNIENNPMQQKPVLTPRLVPGMDLVVQS